MTSSAVTPKPATTVKVTAVSLAASLAIAAGLAVQLSRGHDPVLGPKLAAAQVEAAQEAAQQPQSGRRGARARPPARRTRAEAASGGPPGDGTGRRGGAGSRARSARPPRHRRPHLRPHLRPPGAGGDEGVVNRRARPQLRAVRHAGAPARIPGTPDARCSRGDARAPPARHAPAAHALRSRQRAQPAERRPARRSCPSPTTRARRSRAALRAARLQRRPRRPDPAAPELVARRLRDQLRRAVPRHRSRPALLHAPRRRGPRGPPARLAGDRSRRARVARRDDPPACGSTSAEARRDWRPTCAPACLPGQHAFAADIGGDVRIGGTAGVQRMVEVEHPLHGRRRPRLRDRGGRRRDQRDRDAACGTRPRGFAHHLIDPATGRPAWTGVIQATALAPTALEAETLAKMALLRGPARGARDPRAPTAACWCWTTARSGGVSDEPAEAVAA